MERAFWSMAWSLSVLTMTYDTAPTNPRLAMSKAILKNKMRVLIELNMMDLPCLFLWNCNCRITCFGSNELANPPQHRFPHRTAGDEGMRHLDVVVEPAVAVQACRNLLADFFIRRLRALAQHEVLEQLFGHAQRLRRQQHFHADDVLRVGDDGRRLARAPGRVGNMVFAVALGR